MMKKLKFREVNLLAQRSYSCKVNQDSNPGMSDSEAPSLNYCSKQPPFLQTWPTFMVLMIQVQRKMLDQDSVKGHPCKS